MTRPNVPALLAMALLAEHLPDGKCRRAEAAPPTFVEPITVIQGPETRQQRRARERKAWKRGAR